MILRPITDDKECRDFMNSVPYEEYWPENLPAITPISFVLGVYLQKMAGLKLVGAFVFQLHAEFIEAHACFLIDHRGKFALKAARAARGWIFENTHFDKIVLNIKKRHVAVFARLCGFNRVNDRYEVTRWAVQ